MSNYLTQLSCNVKRGLYCISSGNKHEKIDRQIILELELKKKTILHEDCFELVIDAITCALAGLITECKYIVPDI